MGIDRGSDGCGRRKGNSGERVNDNSFGAPGTHEPHRPALTCSVCAEIKARSRRKQGHRDESE